jgi:hypothetical protein
LGQAGWLLNVGKIALRDRIGRSRYSVFLNRAASAILRGSTPKERAENAGIPGRLGAQKGLRTWMRRQRNSRSQGASQNSGQRDGSLFTAVTVQSWSSTTAGASLRSTIVARIWASRSIAQRRRGILTCHWRHARFDLESGCTFDLWADDAPICSVELRDGEVWVKTTFGHADHAGHWPDRLGSGLAQDINLV